MNPPEEAGDQTRARAEEQRMPRPADYRATARHRQRR